MGRELSVLIVDDKERDMFLIQQVLKTAGIGVTRSLHFTPEMQEDEIHSVIAKYTPNVLFLDTELGIPNKQGYDIARTIKKTYGSGIYIGGLSFNGSYAGKWREAGADKFLAKTDLVQDVVVPRIIKSALERLKVVATERSA